MDYFDFILLRKRGDDKYNCQVLEKGEGEIILVRRLIIEFDIINFGFCLDCREWVFLKSIKYYFRECIKKFEMIRRKKKRFCVVVLDIGRVYKRKIVIIDDERGFFNYVVR